MATPDHWLAKLTRLKVDRASGDPAPHKPLLLLVLLDLAEAGQLPPGVIPLTPELAFRFFTYWPIIAYRRNQRPDVRLPFHHLKSDGFWSARDAQGMPSADYRLTRYAELPADLRGAWMDPAWRSRARRTLIAKYFRPAERVALYAATGIPVPSDDQIKNDANVRDPAEAQAQGREARFRLLVVSAFNYTCALTGYRLTTIMSGSIVDAAHIHQFADSRNNDATNGLALCKNAHWLFDQGLWSVSDDYRVLVGIDRFSEDAAEGKSLESCHGQKLRLPADPRYLPNPVHLAWHRRRHGYA